MTTTWEEEEIIFYSTQQWNNNVRLKDHITSCDRLPERSTPSVPAAYDLNHSNCTVQNMTDKWNKWKEKSRITILNLNLNFSLLSVSVSAACPQHCTACTWDAATAATTCDTCKNGWYAASDGSCRRKCPHAACLENKLAFLSRSRF